MTRKEAQALLVSTNKKITHRYFSPHEYIQGIDHPTHGRILQDENGYMFIPFEFWRWRMDSAFDDGWEEFKDDPIS